MNSRFSTSSVFSGFHAIFTTFFTLKNDEVLMPLSSHHRSTRRLYFLINVQNFPFYDVFIFFFLRCIFNTRPSKNINSGEFNSGVFFCYEIN